MKKCIYLLMVFTLIAATISCSTGKIVVKDDDFTKAKTMTMYLKPGISDWSGAVLMMWENEFYREVKNGRSTPTTVAIKMIGATLVENFTNAAMVKVNDKVFNINGVITETEKKRNTDIDVSTDATGKTTGKTSTREHKEFNLKLTLNPQIEKAMATASAITLRLNAGNKPVTIVYSPKEVESLKAFMTLDPNKPQK
ncbi:MAG: hypothetical protein KA369_17590 [Spirochaetes bacterium]|nr:hypothetical protein [Spirochaetota bacterium]